jgi:hypothetical protein
VGLAPPGAPQRWTERIGLELYDDEGETTNKQQQQTPKKTTIPSDLYSIPGAVIIFALCMPTTI